MLLSGTTRKQQDKSRNRTKDRKGVCVCVCVLLSLKSKKTTRMLKYLVLATLIGSCAVSIEQQFSSVDRVYYYISEGIIQLTSEEKLVML